MNTIGRLQRTNPLPIGTYWIDVIDAEHQQFFAGWTFDNQSKVKVLATEHFDANDWPECSSLDPTTGGCWPSRDWVKFQVLSPVTWDAVKLGFPNAIESGEVINTSSDTATEPDFGDNCDITCQAERVATAVGIIGIGALAVVIAIKVY